MLPSVIGGPALYGDAGEHVGAIEVDGDGGQDHRKRGGGGLDRMGAVAHQPSSVLPIALRNLA